MADRLRRRRRASQDSDEESGSGAESEKSGPTDGANRLRKSEPVVLTTVRLRQKGDDDSECESEDGIEEAVLSDYESADPEENASRSEEEEEEDENEEEAPKPLCEQEAPPDETDEKQEGLKEEACVEVGDGGGMGKDKGKLEKKLAGERQSGDGQESTDDPENTSDGKVQQKLDDDEDRKNPAYVPRKGLFFEHDVRGQALEEDIRPNRKNKKLWKDEGRWEHDRFREEEQVPKSREELIAMYGYDIRRGPGDSRPHLRKPRNSSSPSREKRWTKGPKPGFTSWHGGAPLQSTPAATSASSSAPVAGRRSSSQPAPRNSQANRHLLAGTQRHRGGRGQAVPEEEEEEEEPVERDLPRPRELHSSPGEVAVARVSSPNPERPVEKKSYSLARRTRTRPPEPGKQAPAELPAVPTTESWVGPGPGEGQEGFTGLDEDLARLGLGGQNWPQSPPSYLPAELRGLPNVHVASGQPQYDGMEDVLVSSLSLQGVGGGRAKQYSSQRPRSIPEPGPIIGIMEGHYYEPMTFQGPIYTHNESPAPLAPQGILVQPEVHLAGLHSHQSGTPIPNPQMFAAPPVSLSPGQPPPQQLLGPPFYPPTRVMAFEANFPYPTGATLPPIYPNHQAQSQVYGGVTYYNPVQQQALPKPSPPRRSSQPVSIKHPPPDVPVPE